MRPEARAGRARVASAQRLRQARSRIPRSEKALTVYTVVLVALIYGTPALIASRDGWGAGAGSPVSLVIAGLALSIAFFAAGRSRGPLMFTVADVDLLLASPAPRTASARWRPALLTLVFASVGALVGAIVLAPVQPPDPGAGAAIVEGALGGIGLGVGVLIAWTLGEAGRRYALLCVPGLALAAWAVADPSRAAWAMAGTPPLWGAALASSGHAPFAALVVVALAGIAIVAQRILLVRAPGERLRRQADRWDRARSAATTLDLRTAAGALGDRTPRFFRTMRLSRMLGGSGMLRAVFARDLVGGIRRWPELATGAALVALGSGILAAAPDTNWSLAAVALVTVGTGRAAGGLRAHAENLGRANHLDPPIERAAWAHTALPSAVGAVGLLAGLVVGTDGWAALCAVLVVVNALVLLIPAAYRFRPPEALMGPINTPAGDLSSAVVVAWWIRTHLFLVGTWWLALLLPPPARVVLLAAVLLLAVLWAHRSFVRERTSVAG